jgi:hypothetical protein
VRVGVALSSVLLACAACGGGTGDEKETSAAKRANDPAAKTRAENVVLKLSDFPAGWRGSAPDPEEAGGDKFRKCIGVDFSGVTITGEAESQDFAMGQNTEAASKAQVFETEAQATEGLQEFASGMASAAVEDCVKQLVEEGTQTDQRFEVGEVDVGELSFTAPDVDEAKAWQIVVPVTVASGAAKGVSATAYLEIVELREGDMVAQVETSDVLTPFDPALRQQLVDKVAGRMAVQAN